VGQIGIGHHQGIVLGTALGDHPLARGPAARVDDVLGHRSRAHKADALEARMIQHGGDHISPAVDDVPYAIGKAGLLHQFRDAHLAERILAGGLDDDAVAGGHGKGREPQGHHKGKVERTDDAKDPQRLADEVLVDAGGDILQVLAHHQRGDARRHLHHLDTPARLPTGFINRLAVLLGLDAAELLKMPLHQVAQAQQATGAGQGRRATPVLPGGIGRLHRAV